MEETYSDISLSSSGDSYHLLNKINSPSDLRRLPLESLPAVCVELRNFLIENLSSNPGHFASSMGAVELIVALHYVYDTPSDRIVYDVGHQAYAHKILTGRREEFKKQRTLGGIAGFPSPSESIYDTFTAGHAGNSISAALGMAIADKLTPKSKNRKTVAVIGDASISCGLAFEGLNNAANSPNDLLIILNDNEMSIDNNVGALHKYLSELTTSQSYNRLRFKLYNYFKEKGVINDRGKGRIIRFNNSLKALISRQQNIFEGLNIRYFGPFDGHDVIRLVKTLREIKDMRGPRILHINTKKGKGFRKAEEDPTTWHAPGKFDPLTGIRLKNTSGIQPPKWQDIFGDALVELATDNPDIVGITAAMPTGTSINKLAKTFPSRTFDTGISEGHAVTFAGGLASAGKHPFVAIYSAFLQRAYDNIINDVAIQHLPVTFCIDRAGLVGEDGVTHHGVFDMAYLNSIPGMIVASPADEESLRNLMFTASKHQGPMAIRYPRGATDAVTDKTKMKLLTIGKGRYIIKPKDAEVAILTIGPKLKEALKAAEVIKNSGKSVIVADMIWMKPLDMEIIEGIAKSCKKVITLEDGIKMGGFGEKVSAALKSLTPDIEVIVHALPDEWIAHGTPAQLSAMSHTDADAILENISCSDS